MPSNTDHLIEPLYDFYADPARVLLRQGVFDFVIDGRSHPSEVEFRLDLLPTPRVCVHGRVSRGLGGEALRAVTQGKDASFRLHRHKLPGHIAGVTVQGSTDPGNRDSEVRWHLAPRSFVVQGSDRTRIGSITFHILNFVNFRGTRSAPGSPNVVRFIDMADEQWQVCIGSLPQTEDSFDKLKAEGGYRLTHTGTVASRDGDEFTGRCAAAALSGIRFLLSFAKGGWCEPILAVGVNSAGKRVWEQWSRPSSSWQTPLSCLCPGESEQLAMLFPGFMARWAQENWENALRESLYWYFSANRQWSPEGIILAQTAIERLSYEFVVENKKLITAKGFKDLWASDRFRLLFSSLGIPLDIPVAATELARLAKSMGWCDAPHAITEIRNSIVHPDHKHRGKLDVAHPATWNLSLWYLEMAILALCGYRGRYTNRLISRWAGECDTVPWA